MKNNKLKQPTISKVESDEQLNDATDTEHLNEPDAQLNGAPDDELDVEQLNDDPPNGEVGELLNDEPDNQLDSVMVTAQTSIETSNVVNPDDLPICETIEDIKIYDGTTIRSRAEYDRKKQHIESQIAGNENLFGPLEASTLTAQGYMTNITFNESLIIDTLSKPTGAILKIGCNYGELYNDEYKEPGQKPTSGRGRKPKIKTKTRRKLQGNGKYFSSQITFLIRHPDSDARYKIKLFRNGVFQVPGIKNPNMHDLVKPIIILRDYLIYNFKEDVQVANFMAVMRNYKTRLVNQNYHVSLGRLEEIILNYKKEIIDQQLNPMRIAEMTYNIDRCCCLIIKFYRPSIIDPSKKTTVKLLKTGKINFDGGNSQQEIEELYLWLRYIYTNHRDAILFDINNIKNEEDSDTSDCEEKSIYDDDLDDSDMEHPTIVEQPTEKRIFKNKAIRRQLSRNKAHDIDQPEQLDQPDQTTSNTQLDHSTQLRTKSKTIPPAVRDSNAIISNIISIIRPNNKPTSDK